MLWTASGAVGVSYETAGGLFIAVEGGYAFLLNPPEDEEYSNNALGDLFKLADDTVLPRGMILGARIGYAF